MDLKHKEGFPWRLENGDVICHFVCKEHLQKYLDRYKLNIKKCNIENKDGESFEPSKKHKKSLQPKFRKSNNRSTSTVCKGKSNVDSPRNSSSNSKRKKTGD